MTITRVGNLCEQCSNCDHVYAGVEAQMSWWSLCLQLRVSPSSRGLPWRWGQFV